MILKERIAEKCGVGIVRKEPAFGQLRGIRLLALAPYSITNCMSTMRVAVLANFVFAAFVAACSGSHETCTGGACSDAAIPVDAMSDAMLPPDMTMPIDMTTPSDLGVDASIGCLPHAATEHRASAATCDMVRLPGSPPDPSWMGECATDADCAAGNNGRCTGNSHDGWRCTYDMCFADSDCDATRLCACEGGFRSDENVCLPSNCRSDAECATGFCSPTLGSCGHYTSWVGYFCHTCDDLCVNDEDCPLMGGTQPGYCAYSTANSRWQCEYSECVG